MLDIQSPIIAIGAGRSGSTLLQRMLNKHPKITFFNENSFLAARLWLELWQDRFWFDSKILAAAHRTSAHDPNPGIDPEFFQQQKTRIGQMVAKTVADVHQLKREQCQVWGYKEIWNGADENNYSWDIYDAIFPRAYWVHLVRNPFTYARSNTNWNREPLTLDFLEERLRKWVLMCEKNSRSSLAERYCEIRFEDLLNAPQPLLAPLLEANGLDWDDACLEALDKLEMNSVRQKAESTPYNRTALTELVGQIDGLREWMERFDYAIPEGFEQHVIAPQPDFRRADFAKLNRLTSDQTDSTIEQHYHLPHRMLKHITLIQEKLLDQCQQQLNDQTKECDKLHIQNSEWERSNQESQQIINHLDQTVKEQAEQQQEWEREREQLDDQNRKLRQDYLEKLARHPLYYFCVQRYHQAHALLEQRSSKKKDKPS